MMKPSGWRAFDTRTMNDLDMIISMNFQHIVKRKTKIGTGSINAINGYRVVEICTPMEVNDNEKT
jgi:hypothetical protein